MLQKKFMNNDLFQKLKELNLPKGKFAVFGSGPMAVRGLRECRDLDVIVAKDVFDEFKNKKEWELKKTEKSEYLENSGIELWKDWGPDWFPEGTWDIQKLINEAEIIDDLPFVKLEEVLKWKNILRREKDLADIKLIEDFYRD